MVPGSSELTFVVHSTTAYACLYMNMLIERGAAIFLFIAGVGLLADFAQTNCHFVAAIVSRSRAVVVTLTQVLLDLSVDIPSGNQSVVGGRDVIRTLRAAAQGGARAEVFVSSKASADPTNSSKDGTTTCCVSELVKLLQPERGADTAIEAAEAVYWISRR